MLKQTIRQNRVLAIPFCCWLLGLSILLPAGALALEGEEYAVKAAFILNFAKGTSWPNTKDDNSRTTSLCLVGNDDLLTMAFQSIDGKPVGDKTLRIRQTTGASDCQGCDILFISNDINPATLLRLFAAIKDKPVLTIGETPDFSKIGGIINFINKNGRLHFEINPCEAKRHGLKIRSDILQLAAITEEN